MATIPFSFVGPSYKSQSPSIDCEECINFYVEQFEATGTKVRSALYPCPGFTAFATLPTSPTRGFFSQDDRCFVVSGTKFYEIFANGTAIERGTCAIDQYPATMCSNGLGGHQVFITSGGRGDLFNLTTNVYTQGVVTGGIRFGGFLDGYFLALDTNASRLYISGLEDGSTWDPTDFAIRSSAGDKWQAMAVARRQIWLMGSATTDLYYNSGDPLFPFAPVDGGFLEQGIAAPFSIDSFDETVSWLAANQSGTGTIVRATEGQHLAVSTEAVNYSIQGFARDSTIADAVSFTYQDQGHAHHIFNFPTAKTSWVFDAKTSLFHQRMTWNPTVSAWTAYRPQYHTFCFNKHLVGDRESGAIYAMDISTATEIDGAGIRRVRTAPVYLGGNDWVFHQSLEVELEVGLGLTTGQGSDPTIALSYSDNGGKTFGNELWRTAGALGTYGTKIVWERLGRAMGNRRVYRTVMTDPIPWRMAGATIKASATAEQAV